MNPSLCCTVHWLCNTVLLTQHAFRKMQQIRNGKMLPVTDDGLQVRGSTMVAYSDTASLLEKSLPLEESALPLQSLMLPMLVLVLVLMFAMTALNHNRGTMGCSCT